MMWFFLASQFGMTVVKLKEEMIWREFVAWTWYLSERPFGDVAQDMRTIDVMAFHANMNSGKKGKKLPMQYFTEKRKRTKAKVKQTAEQAAALVRSYAKKFS